MEHCKRMVLVDERMLPSVENNNNNNITTKDVLQWKRPSEQSAKTLLTKQMSTTIQENDIPDDVKCKLYQQALVRFLNMNKKLPTETETPLIDLLSNSALETEDQSDAALNVKTKKRKNRTKRKSLVKNLEVKTGEGEELEEDETKIIQPKTRVSKRNRKALKLDSEWLEY